MGKAGVVAFGFGAPYSVGSNLIIAEIVSQKAVELGAPVFTQKDVRIKPGIHIEYCAEAIGHPPPTLRIAREAVQWARRNNFTELWLACAKPHLWRCERDLKYAIKEIKANIIVCICEKIMVWPEDEWFCLSSLQARTRSLKTWRRREKFLESMPMWAYKLVAS